MSIESFSNEVVDSVDKLIAVLTSEIDSDNFKRCVDFILYQISSNKYSIPNQNRTQQLLETYSTKYDYLGFQHYAVELSTCVNNYVKPDPSDKNDNVENKWRILEFLTNLANDPFKTENIFSLEDKLKISKNAVYPGEITQEECINWHEYLQEGSEKFKLLDEESDDDSFITQQSFRENETEKSAVLYNDIFKGFRAKESIVVDEKTMLLNTFSEAVQSKNWLTNHKQHSWWYEYHCSETDSKYPSSNFGIKWDKAQNTLIYSSQDLHATKYQYYTEYKIIRELFWLLITNDKQRIPKRIQFLRSQVSATSIIKETFSLFIRNVLDTASKYHELRSFTDEIFSDILQVPFTYQAYSSVLMQICKPFLQKIVQLEAEVRKQDGIDTLLRVQDDLKPYLDEINFVHDIHSKSLHSNWRNEPAWLVTVRLLSMVCSKFHVVLPQAHIQLLLKIFFKTFKAYADIIDQWLTEGKLDDWKNEFYIRRLGDGTCIVFPCDKSKNSHIKAAEFFHKIALRLLNCSKNVDFLYKLNKMSQLRSEILKEGTLIHVFVKEFVKRIFKQNRSNLQYATVLPEQTNQQSVDSNLPHSQIEFLSQDTINLYLVRCFAEELNIGPKAEPPNKEEDIFDELNNLPDLEIFCISSVIESALDDVISKRENIIVNFFKSSLVREYRLFDHIRNLSDLMLMDLHGFCNKINIRLEKKIWEGNHLIKVFLHGCVESNKLAFGSLFHFTMDQEDQYTENVNVCVSEIIKVIDTVHLQYMVQWPMNMIFNDNIIKNFYEKLFKLVLKVNTAFQSVTRLCYKDLPHTKIFILRARRMHMLRYWVVQLLNRIKSYLSLIISQCLDVKTMEKVVHISTFSSLQAHYSKYLESIKKKCLIYPELYNSLESAFNRIWHVCDDVRDLWAKSIKLLLTDQDVTRSVELYVQCLWYFTQILERFAKHRSMNNPLRDLWSDLAHMIEDHKSTIPEDLSFRDHADESFM